MMTSRVALTEAELGTALAQLDGWAIEEGKLTKRYKFGSFAKAMGWMMAVAIEADKLDHHPEWSNVYSRVTVQLVTHDIGNKIGGLDVLLAQKMDALA